MVKIRGNRIYITPEADAEIPEPQRRRFIFANPSVTMYERVIEKATLSKTDEKASISLGSLAGMLLRGWDNIRTDDATIAQKYAVGAAINVQEPPPADGYAVSYVNGREVEFFDLLTHVEVPALWEELFLTLNPQPSGNSALPPSSQPATSVTNAGPESAVLPPPSNAASQLNPSSGQTSPATSVADSSPSATVAPSAAAAVIS
jgi:hypothetical protein